VASSSCYELLVQLWLCVSLYSQSQTAASVNSWLLLLTSREGSMNAHSLHVHDTEVTVSCPSVNTNTINLLRNNHDHVDPVRQFTHKQNPVHISSDIQYFHCNEKMHCHSIKTPQFLITFCMKRSLGEMYIGHGHLCVCLSLATFLHYWTAHM